MKVIFNLVFNHFMEIDITKVTKILISKSIIDQMTKKQWLELNTSRMFIQGLGFILVVVNFQTEMSSKSTKCRRAGKGIGIRDGTPLPDNGRFLTRAR